MGVLQVVGLVFTMARAKVFALLLGPAGFGVVATIDQLVVSAQHFSNLSLPFTALKYLSRSHSVSEEEFRKSYAAFLKAITILAVVATAVLVPTLPALLASLDPQLVKYRGPVSIALLGIPSIMLLVFFVHVLAAQGRTLQSALLALLSSVVVLASGWVGCVLGGIQGIYLATVPASTALIAAMAVFASVKMRLPWNCKPMQQSKGLRANAEIVDTAVSTYIAVGSYSALLLLARYVSITHLSEEAAGLLQASLAVALSLGGILLPSNTLYLAPYLNRSIPGTEKIAAANRFLPRLLFLYCLGALPVLLFPEFVLRLLFSGRFTPAAAMLPWFVVWQCLYQVSHVYQQLLIGLDDARGYCVGTAFGHLFGAALCFWLIGPFGLAGVGAAFIAGTFCVGCVTVLRLHWKHRLALPKSGPTSIVLAALGLAGTAALARMTVEMTLPGACVRVGLASAFLTALWFALPRDLSSQIGLSVTAKVRALTRRTLPLS